MAKQDEELVHRDQIIDGLHKEVEKLKAERSHLKLVMNDRDNTFRGLIESERSVRGGANLNEGDLSYDELRDLNYELNKRNKEIHKQLQMVDQEAKQLEQANIHLQQELHDKTKLNEEQSQAID